MTVGSQWVLKTHCGISTSRSYLPRYSYMCITPVGFYLYRRIPPVFSDRLVIAGMSSTCS